MNEIIFIHKKIDNRKKKNNNENRHEITESKNKNNRQ